VNTPEILTFDKGLNTRRNSLALDEGELVSASGISLKTPGTIQSRTPKAKVNTTAVGSIHSLHRYKNYVMLGDSKNARYKWDLNGYCNLYTSPNENFTSIGTLGNSNSWRFADNEDFVFFVNGYDSKAFCGGTLYDWIIPNPDSAPSGTQGDSASATTPSGTYQLYYTYLIHFPNGRIYETGPSPMGTVTVAAQKKINWSKIGISTYSGAGVTIHRKLYRQSTSLVDAYYVTTIGDNTTTTYVDDFADGTLDNNTTISTYGYSGPPEGMVDVTYYMSRVFGIKESTLYPSGAYLPFTFDWGDSIQVSPSGIDLVSIISWGDQLYFATTEKWYRLQGGSPTTWSIKTAFSEIGTNNRKSCVSTRFGIIHQWYDGLYLFDGSTARCITKDQIALSVFSNMTSPKSAYGYFDGLLYRFFYPSTGTTLDSCLVIDFSDFPKMKFYNEDFITTAGEYHFPTGIFYYGKSDGYQYEEGSAEVISMSFQTGDRASKDILHRKQMESLFYEIDTNSKDVIVTFYIDGIAQTPTITLNTSTRTREKIPLSSMWEGYRFSIKINCVNSQNVKIYEPWIITTNISGT